MKNSGDVGMKNISRKTVVLLSLIFIFVSTFVYSALAISFSITSNVTFRVLSDIRVTSSKISDTVPAGGGAVMAYESRFNIDSVSNGFKLPNANSSISYKVKVENFGDIDQTIYSIKTTSNNQGLNVSITSYEVRDIIESKDYVEFTITYTTTTPSNEIINVVNYFDYRKVYKIVYDTNGGSVVPTQYKYEREDITLASAPTKLGYTFNGWSIDGETVAYQAGATYTVDDDTTPTLTLYALWTYNATPTINVTDHNTFSYSATSGSKYLISTTQSTKPNANDSNWTTATTTGDLTLSSTGTYYVWVKDANENVSDNKATIAVRSVTRSEGTGTILTTKYDSTSGTAFTTSPVYVLNGSKVNVTGTLKSGYSSLSLKNGTSTISSGDQTINANASFTTSAVANTYTLTINPNGGTFNNKTTNTTVTQNYGTTYNVANNATRTGYIFGGWKLTTGDGNITWFEDSEKVKQYLINSASVSKPIVYNNKENGTVTHTIITDSTSSTGYSMKITTNGTAHPGAGGFQNHNYAVAGAIYYHKIVAKVPIGYNLVIQSNTMGVGYTHYWLTSNSGTGDWETYIYAAASGYNGPFSSFGYVCANGSDNTSVTWYVNESTMYRKGANLSEVQSSNLDFEFLDSDATLTAQWSASGATVTWNTQSGTLVGTKWATTTAFRYNTAYTGTKKAPNYISDTDFGIYRKGYTFAGWYTATSGGTQVFTSTGELNASVSGYSDANKKWLKYDSNVTLYARWTPNTYTVTANANGGTIATTTGWTGAGNTSTKSVTYNEEYGTLPTVSRTGYTFEGWSLLPESLLPEGYKQVEYIESTGTQYIDTGIYPNQDTSIEFTVKGNEYEFRIGELNSSGNENVFYATRNQVGFGNTYTAGNSVNPVLDLGVKHTYKLENAVFYQDGVQKYPINNTATSFQSDRTILVFAVNRLVGSVVYVYGSGGILYDLKIYDDEELVRNYVPCINESTGKAGLYDLVSGIFYGNNGTGDFTVPSEAYYLTSESIVDIPSNHYIYAKWAQNICTITLDDQNSTSAGTGTIYEKYNEGYYLDSETTTQMTSNSNSITIPTKTDYVFEGYYTQANGNGTQVIDENGNLVSGVSTTIFSSNSTLYANWTENNPEEPENSTSSTNSLMMALSANEISYDNSATGLECTNAQCALDKVKELIGE